MSMVQNTNENVPLVLMITIINRGKDEGIIKMFIDHGVTFNLLSLGKGTANSVVLDYLGLGETEKEILFSTMPLEISKILLKKIDKETNMKKPGCGVAFTLPIGSVGGYKAVKQLSGLSEVEGGKCMEQSFDHDLIIAIANRGFSDDVMDAARSANATGGTVINARGLGAKEAEKFFGFTIQPEKELIMIITEHKSRQFIMESIANKAGIQTDAKAIVFSLPVNGVIGLSDAIKRN